MFGSSSLFDKEITPACEYCEFGRDSSEYNMVMCRKRGIVSPYFRCKKFRYDPLRRTPKRDDAAHRFTAEDFTL